MAFCVLHDVVLYQLGTFVSYVVKMDRERCQRQTTYEGYVLMGYLGVYIWWRSTILGMILGSMPEELSSVKPIPGLGLDNGSRLLVTPQNSLIQRRQRSIEIEYRHTISVAP